MNKLGSNMLFGFGILVWSVIDLVVLLIVILENLMLFVWL